MDNNQKTYVKLKEDNIEAKISKAFNSENGEDLLKKIFTQLGDHYFSNFLAYKHNIVQAKMARETEHQWQSVANLIYNDPLIFEKILGDKSFFQNSKIISWFKVLCEYQALRDPSIILPTINREYTTQPLMKFVSSLNIKQFLHIFDENVCKQVNNIDSIYDYPIKSIMNHEAGLGNKLPEDQGPTYFISQPQFLYINAAQETITYIAENGTYHMDY